MTHKNNQYLKKLAKEKGVYQWQIADVLKVSEPTLVRWMRYPLDNEKTKAYLNAIDIIASQGEADV